MASKHVVHATLTNSKTDINRHELHRPWICVADISELNTLVKSDGDWVEMVDPPSIWTYGTETGWVCKGSVGSIPGSIPAIHWPVDATIGGGDWNPPFGSDGQVTWGEGTVVYLGVEYTLASGGDEHGHDNPYTDDFTTVMVGVVTLENTGHTAEIRFVPYPYTLQEMEFAAVLYVPYDDVFIPLNAGLTTRTQQSISPLSIITSGLHIVGRGGSPGGFTFDSRYGYTGLMAVGEGSGVYVRPLGNSASDPGPLDDTTKGYEPTALWVNSASKQAFICISNGVNSAVWKPITT
jgi:hypothetical protein